MVEFTTIFNGDISQSVTVTPSLAATVTRVVDIAQTVTVADAITATVNYVASVAQAISVSDTIGATTHFVVAIAQAITTSDSISAMQSLFVDIAQGVIVSDNLTGNLVKIVEIVQAISVSDAITNMITRIVDIAQAISVVDTISSTVHYMIGISQGVSVSDSITAAFNYVIEISQAISVSDSLGAISGFVVSISQAIEVTDAVQGVIGFVVSIPQTISILEELAGILVPYYGPPPTVGPSGNNPPPSSPSLFEVGPEDVTSNALVYPSLSTSVIVPTAIGLIAGEPTKFDIVIRWSGDDHIRIQDITFSEHNDWFTVEQALPAVARVAGVNDLHSPANKLEVKIPVTVRVPADVTDISHVIEAIVTTSSNPDTSLNVHSHIAQIKFFYVTEPMMDWMLISFLMVIGVIIAYAATHKFRTR